MMRVLIVLAGLLAGAALAQTATTTPEPPASTAPTVTLNKWQDLAPLVDRQSKWINKLRAENETLRSDLGIMVWKHDVLLRYLVIQACASNEKITQINSVFSWVKPFPLGSLECPPTGSRFYLPSYASGVPPVPPNPQDDFNRSDGAAGANWSAGNIVGNQMRVLGTALWAKPLAADQYIEARMWASSTTEWAYHGLVLRAGAGTKIQFRFTISPIEGKWGVEYMDAAGAHTSLASGPVTYVAGAGMKLAVKGNTLTAWYNGTKLTEVAGVASLTAGSAGLIGLAASGQYATFDDVLVGDL